MQWQRPTHEGATFQKQAWCWIISFKLPAYDRGIVLDPEIIGYHSDLPGLTRILDCVRVARIKADDAQSRYFEAGLGLSHRKPEGELQLRQAGIMV